VSNIRIIIHGPPATAGSKRGFVHPSTGRVVITDDSERSKPWQAVVASAAADAMGDRPLFDGPLSLYITFTFPRPKGHYGRRGLRPSAPLHPTVRPDLLKLARAVEDALTGVVWRDDAQIVDEMLRKRYGTAAVTNILVANLMVN